MTTANWLVAGVTLTAQPVIVVLFVTDARKLFVTLILWAVSPHFEDSYRLGGRDYL